MLKYLKIILKHVCFKETLNLSPMKKEYDKQETWNNLPGCWDIANYLSSGQYFGM